MAYDFYLDKMLCPVPPSTLELEIKGQNKTLTLINEGEINILKKAGLTEISFDLLLPNVQYPFATYKEDEDGNVIFQNAGYYLDQLEQLKTGNQPFQFIVTRELPNGTMLFDTNIKVSLEDYTIKEDKEEGFDVVVSVKLKQYKDYGTKTCTVKIKQEKKQTSTKKQTVTKTTNRSNTNKTTNKTYTVKKGDCLWNIAKKFYGKGSEWKKIYNANKNVIEKAAKKHGKKSSSNGHWIYPGTKLTIPGTKAGGSKK